MFYLRLVELVAETLVNQQQSPAMTTRAYRFTKIWLWVKGPCSSEHPMNDQTSLCWDVHRLFILDVWLGYDLWPIPKSPRDSDFIARSWYAHEGFNARQWFLRCSMSLPIALCEFQWCTTTTTTTPAATTTTAGAGATAEAATATATATTFFQISSVSIPAKGIGSINQVPSSP